MSLTAFLKLLDIFWCSLRLTKSQKPYSIYSHYTQRICISMMLKVSEQHANNVNDECMTDCECF